MKDLCFSNPMNYSESAVLLDVDNTATELDRRIADVYSIYTTNAKISPRTSIDYRSMFPDETSEYLTEFIWKKHKREIFSYLDVFPNIRITEFLYVCKIHRFNVALVTANLNKDFAFVWGRYWLPHSLFSIPNADKYDQIALFAIDDEPEAYKKHVDNYRICFLLDKPYNRDFKINPFFRLTELPTAVNKMLFVLSHLS